MNFDDLSFLFPNLDMDFATDLYHKLGDDMNALIDRVVAYDGNYPSSPSSQPLSIQPPPESFQPASTVPSYQPTYQPSFVSSQPSSSQVSSLPFQIAPSSFQPAFQPAFQPSSSQPSAVEKKKISLTASKNLSSKEDISIRDTSHVLYVPFVPGATFRDLRLIAAKEHGLSEEVDENRSTTDKSVRVVIVSAICINSIIDQLTGRIIHVPVSENISVSEFVQKLAHFLKLTFGYGSFCTESSEIKVSFSYDNGSVQVSQPSLNLFQNTLGFSSMISCILSLYYTPVSSFRLVYAGKERLDSEKLEPSSRVHMVERIPPSVNIYSDHLEKYVPSKNPLTYRRYAMGLSMEGLCLNKACKASYLYPPPKPLKPKPARYHPSLPSPPSPPPPSPSPYEKEVRWMKGYGIYLVGKVECNCPECRCAITRAYPVFWKCVVEYSGVREDGSRVTSHPKGFDTLQADGAGAEMNGYKYVFMKVAKEMVVNSKTGFQVVVPMLCHICHEAFRGGSVIISSFCSHVFHRECIRRWVKISNICPLCSFNLS